MKKTILIVLNNMPDASFKKFLQDDDIKLVLHAIAKKYKTNVGVAQASDYKRLPNFEFSKN